MEVARIKVTILDPGISRMNKTLQWNAGDMKTFAVSLYPNFNQQIRLV